MDRGKDGNRNANGGLAEATASRLRFESDEEAEEVEGPDAEGEEEQAAEEVIGSDKTSADYYFDSYSHFGIHEVSDSGTSLAFVDHFPSSWFLITLNFHREDIYANYFLVLTAGNA